MIVADPYKDLVRDMRVAFYIGQSTVVGDTTTDVIAYANDVVFVQAWVGAQDKLPRMLRAVFIRVRSATGSSNRRCRRTSSGPSTFSKAASGEVGLSSGSVQISGRSAR